VTWFVWCWALVSMGAAGYVVGMMVGVRSEARRWRTGGVTGLGGQPHRFVQSRGRLYRVEPVVNEMWGVPDGAT